MASKASIKTITALVFAEATVKSFRDIHARRPKNKTIMQILNRIDAATRDAFKVWPCHLTTKEVLQVSGKIEKLKQEHFGTGQNPTVIISFATGMLDDVRGHINDPGRGATLDKVLSGLMRLGHYFDRTGEKFEDYEIAGGAINDFHGMEAA